MQLKRVRLKDFKLFENFAIDLAPITILTGANSSGKSAIITAIAAALQGAPGAFPFEFELNGANCQLGSYRDAVRGHTTKRSFGLGLDVDAGGSLVSLDVSYRYSPRGDHVLPKRIAYKNGHDSIEVAWDAASRTYSCVVRAPSVAAIASEEKFATLVAALSSVMADESRSDAENPAVLTEKVMEQFRDGASEREIRLPVGSSPRDLAMEISTDGIGAQLIANLRTFLQMFGRHVAYVGPIRATPLRYYGPGYPQTGLDPQGQRCAQVLDDWRQHSRDKFDLVADLLRQLELVSGLTTKRSHDEILNVLVRPFGRNDEANFADVGFGVSQALPVVVADVGLPSGGVVLVNQPEVHLHPASQAKLANYMASRVNNRQFIVETHSEYILNRLRVLAMKGELDPELVSIIFLRVASRDRTRVVVDKIGLTKDGRLRGAPRQFFGTYYVDSFELAMGPGEQSARPK